MKFIAVAIDKEFILVNIHWLNSGIKALFILQEEKQIPRAMNSHKRFFFFYF